MPHLKFLFLIAVCCLAVRVDGADTLKIATWDRQDWKLFVLDGPVEARAFIEKRITSEIAQQGTQAVHMGYGLGLAEYLMGKHILSNHSYELALESPSLRERRPPWSDEDQALSMESALWNNMGVNYEILGDFLNAEIALGKSRLIDTQRGNLEGAWTTAINQGLLLSRIHSHKDAIALLRETVSFFELSDSPAGTQAMACLNLSVAENNAGYTADALLSAIEAIELFEAIGDSVGAMSGWVTLGQTQLGRSEFDALGSTLDSMDVWHPDWLPEQIEFYAQALKANYALQMGELEQAEFHLSRMESFLETQPSIRLDSDYLPTALAIASSRGDVIRVVDLAGKFRRAISELFAAKNLQQLSEYQELNESNLKVLRIAQLESDLRAYWWMVFSFSVAFVLLTLIYFIRRNSKLFQERSNRVVFGLLRERLRSTAALVGSVDAPPKVHQEIDNKLSEIFTGIEDLVSNEAVYLNPNLTLGELAGLANSNSRYVSLAIRQERGISFSEYINGIRVEQAQSILLDPANHRQSFEQVAERCGFSSTRTFYRQFSRVTSMSPGEFLRLAKVADGDAEI